MFDFRSNGVGDFFDRAVIGDTSETESHSDDWTFFYNEENDISSDED